MKIMWLPKDGRKLFMCYAARTQKAGEICEISDEELCVLLNLPNVGMLHALKSKLQKRGLITYTTLQCEEFILNVEGKQEPHLSKNPRIRLTEVGEELIKKYSSHFGKFELLCTEYMWFLILLSVIIGLVGVIVTILVAILKD